MTGGHIKKAVGLKISYSFSSSPFGECLIAVTERGICHLGFVEDGKRTEALDLMFSTWPDAEFSESRKSLSAMTDMIFKTGNEGGGKAF